jgi:uncharacterized YccA/Bax inhibitor family protein
MSDSPRHWPDLPPLFLAGVLLNWAGIGVLAISTRQMIVSAILLTLGTVAMFVATYKNRPPQQNKPTEPRRP